MVKESFFDFAFVGGWKWFAQAVIIYLAWRGSYYADMFGVQFMPQLFVVNLLKGYLLYTVLLFVIFLMNKESKN